MFKSIVQNQYAHKANFDRSLYSRLNQLGIEPIQLSSQYRMHPGLLEFPNQAFYDGEIKSEVTSGQRTPQLQLDNLTIHLFSGIYNQKKKWTQNQDHSSTSKKLILQLHSYRLSFKRIITPYSAQQILLQSKLVNHPQIDIKSVDGFQGREKDIIIFSSVRSNDLATIGFLHQKNRVNVAFTRAKNMFLIVGNANHLGKTDNIWGDIVEFYKEKNALFEGTSISSLKNIYEFEKIEDVQAEDLQK